MPMPERTWAVVGSCYAAAPESSWISWLHSRDGIASMLGIWQRWRICCTVNPARFASFSR